MSKPKAIIVGAGINGLCIGKVLLSRGWSVVVCDKGEIPNPFSASYGRHRLIHPWVSRNSQESRNAGNALRSWQTLLAEIGLNGLVPTGVVVANATREDSSRSLLRDSASVQVDYEDAVLVMPQLAGGDFFNLTLYPAFGCLLADQILSHLADHLADAGAVLIPDCEVTQVDPAGAIAIGRCGRQLEGDLVFVASGTGTGTIMDSLGMSPITEARRCYVLYAEAAHGKEPAGFGQYCWASLGSDDDLWGMPAVRGIPVKLGCGNLTEPASRSMAEPETIKKTFLEAYLGRFPSFLSTLGKIALYHNHWTQFTRQELVSKHDRMVLITACSGGGFKFAPETAKQVCDSVSI